MKSIMGSRFETLPGPKIQRSVFDRSHGLKTTFDAGYLVPVLCDDVLPGDTFNCKTFSQVRLATPLKPIMDNIYLDIFYFFVPARILWSNFKKLMGEQVNPGDSTSYLLPTLTAPAGGYVQPSNWASPTNAELCGALSDYFGLPTKIAGYSHHSMFHRAYNLIYSEWFRDENLINSPVLATGDGPDTYTDYPLRKRCKRPDFFTSCLPWPQKGNQSTFPIGSTAPVTGIGIVDSAGFEAAGAAASTVRNSSGGTSTPTGWYIRDTAQASAASNTYLFISQGTSGYPNIQADLSSATAATINALRYSFAVQSLFERDALSGTRYAEIIKGHFGITSSDARVQRPEFLGGGTCRINIAPISQSSGSGASGTTTPQGNLSGVGAGGFEGQGFVKSFEEHGYIIGLVNARADITYQQGLDRMFSRSTKLDHYWPSLAQLGERAVLNKEIYCDNSVNDSLVFGYQEMWSEYRYKNSRICGRFRSNEAASLHSWHLSQQFGSLPVLGSTFIQASPPIDRCVAVSTEPDFIGDFYFQYKCVRPIPMFSAPGLFGRF